MSSIGELPDFAFVDDDFSAEEETDQKNIHEVLDFRMVTFSLGGKDYGIDIMKVREISKASRFTFVPNSVPSVRGVYNLRGEIISIIDLRIMFNVPISKPPVVDEASEENSAENMEEMIILRLEENTLGVIVDKIDKVIAISSTKIQPSHPLFGDVNIKFINGIVENGGRLYILLDVERIFGQEDSLEQLAMAPAPRHKSAPESAASPAAAPSAAGVPVGSESDKEAELEYGFVSEALANLKKFYTTSRNQEWVRSRFGEWRESRKKRNLDTQFNKEEEADEFLAPFYSQYTGQLWSEEFINQLKGLMPKSSGSINIWNIGCGKGTETYSVACLANEVFKGQRIKVWGHDNNLLEISSAPSLMVQKNQTAPLYHKYLVESRNGFQFNAEIKEQILFEYHDITHPNQLPPLDIVIMRDVMSFLDEKHQQKIMTDIAENLKKNGCLIVGKNERIEGPDWKPEKSQNLIAYIKN